MKNLPIRKFHKIRLSSSLNLLIQLLHKIWKSCIDLKKILIEVQNNLKNCNHKIIILKQDNILQKVLGHQSTFLYNHPQTFINVLFFCVLFTYKYLQIFVTDFTNCCYENWLFYTYSYEETEMLISH